MLQETQSLRDQENHSPLSSKKPALRAVALEGHIRASGRASSVSSSYLECHSVSFQPKTSNGLLRFGRLGRFGRSGKSGSRPGRSGRFGKSGKFGSVPSRKPTTRSAPDSPARSPRTIPRGTQPTAAVVVEHLVGFSHEWEAWTGNVVSRLQESDHVSHHALVLSNERARRPSLGLALPVDGPGFQKA